MLGAAHHHDCERCAKRVYCTNPGCKVSLLPGQQTPRLWESGRAFDALTSYPVVCQDCTHMGFTTEDK